MLDKNKYDIYTYTPVVKTYCMQNLQFIKINLKGKGIFFEGKRNF